MGGSDEYTFPGPPLPHEAREPASPEEAAYWVDVYRRIISFEERMLERAHEMLGSESDAVQEAVQLTNIEPLEELVQQCRDRLRFWERQHLSIVPDEKG